MISEDRVDRDLIVDTDTLALNDDALALYYLFASARTPRLITTVFGNTSAATSAGHATTLVATHMLDVDVVPGCEKPLWWSSPLRSRVRALVAALPAATYLAALRPDSEQFWDTGVEDGPAPAALAAALTQSQASDIIALGPGTNIARALRLVDPSVPPRHRLWIAGGSTTSGNVTEHAEFNAFADPEGLQQCLSAGWAAVVMVPLEVLAGPRLVPTAVARIRRAATPLGTALDRLETESPRGESTDREPIWDVVATVLAVGDQMYPHKTGALSVVTDLPCRGRVLFRKGEGTHRLVTAVDQIAIVRQFESMVSQPGVSP